MKAVEVVREEPIIAPLAPEIEGLVKKSNRSSFRDDVPAVPATTEDAAAVTKEIAVRRSGSDGWFSVDLDEQLDLYPAA